MIFNFWETPVFQEFNSNILIMNNFKFIFFIVLSLLFACQSNPDDSSEQDSVATEVSPDTVFHGIDGADNYGVLTKECYLEVSGRDSLILTIEIDEQFAVKGQLKFANYQMDSSQGEVTGKIIGDTLVVMHEFQAEGAFNKVQRVFLRKNNQYFLGKGETDEVDGVYIYSDRSKINFEDTRVLDRIECDIT